MLLLRYYFVIFHIDLNLGSNKPLIIIDFVKNLQTCRLQQRGPDPELDNVSECQQFSFYCRQLDIILCDWGVCVSVLCAVGSDLSRCRSVNNYDTDLQATPHHASPSQECIKYPGYVDVITLVFIRYNLNTDRCYSSNERH